MEVAYFKNQLPKDLYRKLNKDQGVNYYFRSNRVGKCVQIFDDYYQQASEVTTSGWHDYYFNQCNVQSLREATQYIVQKHGLSTKEAKQYIYHRIIGQTWNGMREEFNAITQLRDQYPNIEFVKAPYEVDEMYFTDWEAYSSNRLIFGLQIKPHTYQLMNSAYQVKAKENHTEQKKAYMDRFRVAHFMVYYKDHKVAELEKLCNKIDTYLAYNVRLRQ